MLTCKQTQRLADQWTGSRCTLDGKPARVIGRLNRFATVAQIPDGHAVDFTWKQVDNVMTFGCRFMSGLTEAE
jgi:hypothetical protein